MAMLERPDGAEIYWEASGDGPTVALCNTFNLAKLDDLIELLCKERRVVYYEPRGVARSTAAGPYDIETGAADLEAVLDLAGPAQATLAIGDGAHRALHVADRRPDLLDNLVITSTGLVELGSGGFSGSTEVLGALMSLMRRDYRSALRSMVAGSNESEAENRDRVEELAATVPQEAALGYLEAWIRAESADKARRLGARLTMMGYPDNRWFPLELFEDMSLALPEANFETTDDGPVHRPDQSAALLLALSGPTA